jgi:HD-like signal output (HDOD) protein
VRRASTFYGLPRPLIGPPFLADNLSVDLDSICLKVSRSENLPVLPQIVGPVLRLVDDPDSSPRAVEKVIEREPALTGKILRVANSAYYGLSQVPSIGRAISVLGLNSIRSLVVAVVYQQIASGKSHGKMFNQLEFWRHSLGVAVAAKIIGKIKMPMRAEELYVAGMMHDIGMLVLDRFCPNEFDTAISYANENRLPLHEAERRLFGFDHSDVGGILAEKWGLTATVSAAMKYHHEAFQDPEHQDTTMIVAAANSVAYMAGLTNNTHGLQPVIDPLIPVTLDIPEEQFGIIATVTAQEVDKAQQALMN